VKNGNTRKGGTGIQNGKNGSPEVYRADKLRRLKNEMPPKPEKRPG